MAKFLTGKDLNEAIYDIIWEADDTLLIVSPYIKLDDYFKQLFLHHKHNHNLEIVIIFGKNEGSPSKSLRSDDFDFFKQFKNISIIYCPNLHAKYYANTLKGMISSINLYDSSFKNNIEYGVLYEFSLTSFRTTVDDVARDYTYEISEKSPAIFIKRPIYDKSFLGKKNYIDCEVLLDQTELMLKSWSKWEKEPHKFRQDYPEYLNATDRDTLRPERKEELPKIDIKKEEIVTTGFCIRTGDKIPFNPQRPMCEKAFKSWNQFKNPDYEESYCHKTGKKSYGKTSMRNPII